MTYGAEDHFALLCFLLDLINLSVTYSICDEQTNISDPYPYCQNNTFYHIHSNEGHYSTSAQIAWLRYLHEWDVI